ncbi:MAG: DUF3071 domain-containing protein [Propionibacteriaceae bacterium]|nr:DUF3071 domain-containing protein [Propionibacteriaceae bacterium]
MDTALSPREIQARIRAGASVEEVASAAGVPVERVEAFAGPVLDERAYIASRARNQHVRRGAETVLHRTLGQIVDEKLAARGIDADALRWDAWKVENRKWLVEVGYESGKAHREATFLYDQDGRFSTPQNDDARWLLGLRSASHGPQPGRRHAADDGESTLELNQDLALVRVVQPPADEPAPDTEIGRVELYAEADAYAEPELAKDEDSGVYDVVPRPESDMDVLLEMLSGLDEDSVEIYPGLLAQDAPPTAADAPAARTTPHAEPPAPPADQPALIEEEANPQPAKKSKRRRAKVPSWDEIVFGSPKTK